MGVFGYGCVCVSVLRLVYMWGVGSPKVWDMSVHGHGHVPIDTYEPMV
jgi:hypothetical protein